MERLVFHSIQYRNGWLAASDLFDMFAQSIKFYTFHYQYRCLENVIHQIDGKNGVKIPVLESFFNEVAGIQDLQDLSFTHALDFIFL